MFIDSRLELSNSQALTATAVSTNVIPMTVVRQVGAGKPLYVHFQVDVAADVANANETYSFDLESDSTAGMGSAADLGKRVIPGADLVAGYRFSMPIPDTGMEEFFAVRYTLGGTTPSMTISAFVTDEPAPVWTAFANAI